MTSTYATLPEKPRPLATPANEPYWQGLREHRLVVQRCSACGKLRHYPRPMCDACYAMDYDWHEIAGRGSVPPRFSKTRWLSGEPTRAFQS